MAIKTQRALRGETSHFAGSAAEEAVARHYQKRGYRVVKHRWRGEAGEIDLITQNAVGLVFVEVKQSRDFARAAARISPRQMRRIYGTAEEYLGSQPSGALSDARFDVALVNGHGEIQIIENAFGET